MNADGPQRLRTEPFPGSPTPRQSLSDGIVIGERLTRGIDGHLLRRAFIWEDGVITVPGTLGGDESIAYAINPAGQVVGTSGTETGVSHATLWIRR